MADEHEVTVTAGRTTPASESVAEWLPPVDIIETPTAFRITMELCGVPPQDIHAGFADGRLSVSGVRRPSDGEMYHYRERRVGRFARAFSFRTPIDGASVSATLARGVLTLTVPKRVPRRIPVT